MKKLSVLLLSVWFVAGCTGGVPEEGGAIDAPVEEEGKILSPFSMAGNVWALEGIYNLETGDTTTLDTGSDGERYALVFDTNTTATGKGINSHISFRTASPFFTITGVSEENEEAKWFTQIASGISRCEYDDIGGRLKFYSNDSQSCLVYKLAAVRNMTGYICYFREKKWGIYPGASVEGAVLNDGGFYFFPSEDLPDHLKTNGAKVEFSGNNLTLTETFQAGDDVYRAAAYEIYYYITLSSLKLIEP
jgi:hypothetical protein